MHLGMDSVGLRAQGYGNGRVLLPPKTSRILIQLFGRSLSVSQARHFKVLDQVSDQVTHFANWWRQTRRTSGNKGHRGMA